MTSPNKSGSSPSPVAVVCDFDGTATLRDIGDEITQHFGGLAHWEAQSARFRRGELDTRGIIEAIYDNLNASESEVRAFAAREARLRPGFAELVEAARARAAPFILASGGLRQYIEAVLEANLSPDLRRYIEVRANEGVFAADGRAALRVTFPGEAASRALGCDTCGSCKRVAVIELRRTGVRSIVGIGDGFADRCLARFADRVFARRDSFLHRHCAEHGIAHEPFETLHAAASAVADMR
ncbi:MAG TPA: MtnX-like HAD-IB family phosphatase [Myxococcales bacterium]|nr:MtnX-like HAD-IB family phosphatase [Myxococcales bacterium]